MTRPRGSFLFHWAISFILVLGISGCGRTPPPTTPAPAPNAEQVTTMREEPSNEYDWLAAVVANLTDDTAQRAYADWLARQGDARADFLTKYLAAARSMQPGDFPSPAGQNEEWVELLGYRLLERIAAAKCVALKDRALRFARPALRMVTTATEDADIALGASKIGGLPDLPPDFAWPPGGDCRAIYNDDTGGTDRLAGFMAQVNFAEIARTQAARDLPPQGVLSFFCFQDIENDRPDSIGVMAVYFPDPSKLVRTTPPKLLTAGNGVIDPRRLTFQETLDLPENSFDGPWTEELYPQENEAEESVLEHFRQLNFENMLGYARATTGGDPTDSRHSRHLILLENEAGCRLHIQINQEDLTARRFDKIKLSWVDFD